MLFADLFDENLHAQQPPTSFLLRDELELEGVGLAVSVPEIDAQVVATLDHFQHVLRFD